MNQLGPEGVEHLKNMASSLQAAQGGSMPGAMPTVVDEDDDDVPDLIDNFEDVSKT